MKASKAGMAFLLAMAGFVLFTLGFFLGRNTGSTIIYESEVSDAQIQQMETQPEQTTPGTTPTQTEPVPEENPSETAPQEQKININTADAAALDQLPGIGPALAQRIIDYREDYGPYRTIDQIKDVKGIGDATFEKLRDRITVEDNS